MAAHPHPPQAEQHPGAPAARLGYRPGLNGLRAVAILLVVAHHTAA